jgi:predicted DNA-binding ribbon-helix-helix protein
MKSLIVKRSVIIGGHKTSVSLEAPFWDGLKEIAGFRHVPLTEVLQKIDTGRDNSNLSSAIRIFVFAHFDALAAGEPRPHGSGGEAPTFAANAAPAIA